MTAKNNRKYYIEFPKAVIKKRKKEKKTLLLRLLFK